MSFEKYFAKKKIPCFKGKYVPFNTLRKMVATNLTDDQEANFIEKFEENFHRVFSFAESVYKQQKEDLDMEKLVNISEFTKLNIVAFKKILKNHDKKSGFSIFKKYKSDFKEKINFLKKIDQLIAKNKSTKKLKQKEIYMIPAECESFVHMTINHRLPKSEEFQNPWTFTLFLDNTQFELYYSQLHKSESSQSLRIVWTGSGDPKNVSIQRETADGTLSQFIIPENYVLDFLNGKNVYSRVSSVNKENVLQAYNEIQDIIVEKKLRPMVKIFSNKIIYKSEKFKLVWTSDIVAIKECSDHELVHNDFPLKEWHRKDFGIESFDRLQEDEIVRVNRAIVDISGEKPEWLSDLLNRNGECVNDFHEYLHGAALLNPGLGEIPFWIPMIKQETIIEIAENPSRLLTPVNNKPIVIPVRVEPKVFFANERTFLSWIQFAIFLGGIGTAMLGLGDYRASFSGIVLIVVASIFSIYSLCLFHWRARRIREKHPGPYDDKYGPFVLVGVFLFAIILCSIFKFPLKK